MTQAEIRAVVVQAVADLFGPGCTPDITDDADIFTDLGLDSLEAVQLVLDLEDRLSIHLPDEEVDDLRTVRQFTAAVARAMTEGTTGDTDA